MDYEKCWKNLEKYLRECYDESNNEILRKGILASIIYIMDDEELLDDLANHNY